MAKKIFCITERSFYYVAAESKEDALKVLEREDPLHIFDEGYGDVRMLSKSEAEEMGLGRFHEDVPSFVLDHGNKFQELYAIKVKGSPPDLIVVPSNTSTEELLQMIVNGLRLDLIDMPFDALEKAASVDTGIWRVKFEDNGRDLAFIKRVADVPSAILKMPKKRSNEEQEPGKCPVCNRHGRLEYDGKAVMEGEHIYYRFTCPDCGATGKEWHEITFDSIVADQKDDSHVQ